MSPPVWEDGRRDAFSPLATEVEADTCVVGLGASGLAAVLELCDRRRTVVAIDERAVAGGAAGRNGGLLLAGAARFYHRAREELGRSAALALYHETMAELDRLDATDMMRRTGSLRIAAGVEEIADCEAHLQALREDGLPAEPYEGPEGSGLLLPTDGVTNPVERCRRMAREATERGARLHESTPALDVQPGRVVTPLGAVHCERVIVAVDGNLERLLPELAPKVRTARCQMLATGAAPEVSIPRPVYRRWGYDYYHQLLDGRVALGGFRDRFAEAEWTSDDEPTPPVQAELERFLRHDLGVRAPVTHRWGGSVGFTHDGLPVLEEVRPGVVAVGGYSGTGNVLGPIFARRAVTFAS